MLTVAQSVKLMMRDAAAGRYKNYTSQKTHHSSNALLLRPLFSFGFIVVGLK